MFPFIKHIDDLKTAVAHKEEIRFAEQPNGTTVACYMISGEDTFDSPEALECRGITFHKDGTVAVRMLHKFFNIDERASTQMSCIDWSKLTAVFDKRDGSMIATTMIDGKPACKTKKTFDSDVAVKAQAYLDNPALLGRGMNYVPFIEGCFLGGATPIFEYTSPNNRIVLAYEEDEMVLLHLRDNVTGKYLPRLALEMLATSYGIPFAKNLMDEDGFNLQALLDSVETAEGIEGYVFQFENGDMVKLKTPWYLALHRTIVFVRYRDIAEMVVDETIDDYKSYLTAVGASHDVVAEIEKKVVAELVAIEKVLDEVYQADKHLDRKDFAIKHRAHQFFGLLMVLFTGKEPDVKAYFKKYMLSEMFSLEQV